MCIKVQFRDNLNKIGTLFDLFIILDLISRILYYVYFFFGLTFTELYLHFYIDVDDPKNMKYFSKIILFSKFT